VEKGGPPKKAAAKRGAEKKRWGAGALLEPLKAPSRETLGVFLGRTLFPGGVGDQKKGALFKAH